MITVKSKQFYPNLKIDFLIEDTSYKNHSVIFVWEDQKISQNIKIDYMSISNGISYFSSIEKNINNFHSDIKFKIICASTFEILFEETFLNLNFIKGKNILYLSQNTYTGYGYAARNYIYQLIKNGYNVQWDFIGETNNYIFSREEEYLIRNCCYNKLEHIDSIIVHHTPEIFPEIARKYPTIPLYGLTTWETTHVPSEWKMYCESVNTLIVPSFFNKRSFDSIQYDIKNIVVWNHTIFPFKKFKTNVHSSLLSKCESLTPLSTNISDILKNKVVYYNISEFTPRKNLEQVIHCFCKKFKKSDNVCLFVKTHTQLYDKHSVYLKNKLLNLLNQYDMSTIPDIIFCFDRYLDESEIQVIHELGDIYFTLNRGEGFGLSTYTAKKIGNKVICGKYGAEKEFLDSNVDILLDYKLEHSDHLSVQSDLYINSKIPVYDNEDVLSKMIIEKNKKTTFNL